MRWFSMARRRVGAASLSISVVMAVVASSVPAAVGAGSAGPAMVEDISVGNSSYPLELTSIGGLLYFSAADADGRELWRSDGTEDGTFQVADIADGPASSFPREMTGLGGDIYFTADDGVNGRELWKTDGSTTALVEDIGPAGNTGPTGLATFDGRLYFSADDGIKGRELWTSDGTLPGTHRVKDIRTGPGSSRPSELLQFGDHLYFTANNQVWRSDGTGLGTKRLQAKESYGHPRQLMSAGGTLFFLADCCIFGYPFIFAGDGTRAGTNVLGSPAFGFDGPVVRLGATLFYLAPFTDELWKVTATKHRTVKVFDGSGDLGSLATAAGKLFFTVDSESERQLWTSNGTGVGTVEVTALEPQEGDALITGVAGEAFFSNHAAVTGRELWRSDGSAGGTEIVDDINPAGDSEPEELTRVGGTLYFAANDGSHGRELWSFTP